MANCRKCDRPLIVKDGKCIYCGESVQGGTPGEIKTTKKSWAKEVTTSLTAKKKNWTQTMLTKTTISIIVSMLLGILLLVYKAWPGCVISLDMLVLAIVLTLFSFWVINLDKGTTSITDIDQLRKNMSHGLTMILLWGGFMFIVSLVCMFISWWAVLIPGIIGIAGLVFALKYVREHY